MIGKNGLVACLAGFALCAIAEEWVYPLREADEITSLDGEWDFTLVRNDDEKPDAVTRESGKIRVPGNWETQGYKHPQYGNQMQNLTGTYVRTFAYDPMWEGRKVMLRLDGVLFGYDLEINGVRIASDVTSAYNLHQFDVTSALKKGENEIKVAVKTRVPGWLWDTNDCWCLAGIFRSVEMFSVPSDGWIADVTFVSRRVKGDDWCAEVKVDVAGGAEKPVAVRLIAPDGAVAASHSSLKSLASLSLRAPRLWTAETPNLYTLEVSYNGETVREKVGIREVSSDEKSIYINGERTIFRGVCWNEIMPKVGRAITRELRREQMLKMKALGVNYIRTAHYPFGVDFYELADELGFYVVDEVPFGSRGSGLLKNDSYEPLLIDRTERTIRRDKNHPCVFMWTFGNENKVRPNTIAVLKYAKAKDPTRLRALPQTWDSLREWTQNPDSELVDVFSGHYFDEERFKYCRTLKKPFFQTEFSHACGNGFSQFEDRWPRILASENFAGGSVWMWQDQAVETDGAFPLGYDENGNPQPKEKTKDKVRKTTKDVQGVWVDDKTFWDSYGERGTDGICYADGTPKESALLMARFYKAFPGLPKVEKPADWETISTPFPVPRLSAVAAAKADSPFPITPEQLLLRVGRKMTVVPQAQTIGKSKDFLYWYDPYILKPEVKKVNKDGSVKVRWSKYDNPKEKQHIDGTIRIKDGVVDYELVPSEKCKGVLVECGLALDLGEAVTRVDWAGLGPYRSYPGKKLHNDFGVWAKDKRDLYFDGARMESRWAVVSDGAKGVKMENADGSDMTFSVENVDGRVVLTHHDVLMTLGGKSYRPGVDFSFTNLVLKGSIRLSEVEGLKLPEVKVYRPFKSTYGF